MGKYKIYFITIFLVVMSMFAFYNSKKENSNYLIQSSESGYIKALETSNPDLDLTKSEYDFATRSFENGVNVLVYEEIAIPLLKMKDDYKFYEHFTQTVIIAVDRSQTNEEINSFSDLLTTDLEINFDFDKLVAQNMWEYPKTHQITLAMANALYGEFDTQKLALDLKMINEEARFYTQNLDLPIIVTFDSVAVQLNKSGRNLEIIIPDDGTLMFDYGAFVYRDSISFSENLNDELINNGYRLIDGSADSLYYPSESEYENAQYVDDINSFNYATSQIGKDVRRIGFETRLYGFTNTIETTGFYLFLVVFLIGYILSIKRRITDEKIRGAIVIGLLLLLYFSTASVLKSLNSTSDFIESLLWYSYYIPILLAPAILVYISINTGRISPIKFTNTIYKIYLSITVILLLFVFTNNFHELVFIVHDHTTTNFDYNTGYFIVFSWVAASLFFALVLLTTKTILSPKKSKLLFPFSASVLIFTYAVLRINGVVFIREFDIGFAVTILVIIYVESLMMSRLIPNNIGYKKLFLNSNLAMQIKDNANNLVYTSFVTKNIDDNFIKRTTPIDGGYFSYYEDYTSLNNARQNLGEVNDIIRQNNEFLLNNSKVRANLATLTAQRAAYDSIDSILNSGAEKIQNLARKLKTNKNKKKIMGTIGLYACLMKRECMLRINVLYKQWQNIITLENALLEVCSFSEDINLNITIGNSYQGDVLSKDILSIYHLFSIAIENAIAIKSKNLLMQIYTQDENIVFSIISDKVLFSNEEIDEFCKNEFRDNLTVKSWEETQVYLFTFHKGEEIEDV